MQDFIVLKNHGLDVKEINYLGIRGGEFEIAKG